MEYQYAASSGTATPLSFGSTTPAAPEKPKRGHTYQCPWQGCDRWLSCPHNVQQHVKEAHTGERDHTCDLCGSAFVRPYGLYRHLKAVHGMADAGPGRGRGGGLQRIGARKRVASDMDVDESSPSPVDADERMPDYSSGQQSMLQNQAAYQANNFEPSPKTCVCGQRSDNFEGFLAHVHSAHGELASMQCSCMMCRGGPFGGFATGEHAFQEYLYRPDENNDAAATTDPTMTTHDVEAENAFAADLGGAADFEDTVTATIADKGDSIDEDSFTANMWVDDPASSDFGDAGVETAANNKAMLQEQFFTADMMTLDQPASSPNDAQDATSGVLPTVKMADAERLMSML